MDCAIGRLDSSGSEVAFGRHSAVSVVVARAGYPEDESKDSSILGYDLVKHSSVFFSSCEKSTKEAGGYRFKGGRLITLTGIGETLEEAVESTYHDLSLLQMSDVFYRRDIGNC